MGGRGGSSGLGEKMSGLDVTRNGDTTSYYFSKQDGVNYYQRGIGGMPEPTPLNMSIKEFAKRIASNGGKAERVTSSQKTMDERQYREDREKTDKFLNKHWYDARPRYGMKGH